MIVSRVSSPLKLKKTSQRSLKDAGVVASFAIWVSFLADEMTREAAGRIILLVFIRRFFTTRQAFYAVVQYACVYSKYTVEERELCLAAEKKKN